MSRPRVLHRHPYHRALVAKVSVPISVFLSEPLLGPYSCAPLLHSWSSSGLLVGQALKRKEKSSTFGRTYYLLLLGTCYICNLLGAV
eukprot:4893507-Pyramimonas_sp.AAC.1